MISRPGASSGLVAILLAALSVVLAAAPRAQNAPERPAAPRRIVSLSPNLTETLFALGAGDRVVAVSDFCIGPPEALALPRVGGWSNPNFESIVALNPDLIVVLGRHETAVEFAARRGIAVAQIPMMNVETIRSGIAELGRRLNCEDRASSLTAAIDARLAAFAAEAADPDRPPPRVFISTVRAPGSLSTLYTVGGGSFLDQAVRLAGGVNVFNDVDQPFPQISGESLIVRRPEVILELEAGIELSVDQRKQLVEDWSAMPTLPAVRGGRIHILTDPDLLIAGPRLPELIERLRRAIRNEPEQPAAEASTGTP
jgi:iron complex transport system substrate-binding protein